MALSFTDGSPSATISSNPNDAALTRTPSNDPGPPNQTASAPPPNNNNNTNNTEAVAVAAANSTGEPHSQHLVSWLATQSQHDNSPLHSRLAGQPTPAAAAGAHDRSTSVTEYKARAERLLGCFSGRFALPSRDSTHDGGMGGGVLDGALVGSGVDDDALEGILVRDVPDEASVRELFDSDFDGDVGEAGCDC